MAKGLFYDDYYKEVRPWVWWAVALALIGTFLAWAIYEQKDDQTVCEGLSKVTSSRLVPETFWSSELRVYKLENGIEISKDSSDPAYANGEELCYREKQVNY